MTALSRIVHEPSTIPKFYIVECKVDAGEGTSPIQIRELAWLAM